VAKKRQPMLPGMPRNRDLLTPQARYKKGYTPERQAKIADALKDTDVDYIHTGLGGGRASEFAQSARWDSGLHRGLINRSRQSVVSAFANSSIKPNHLQDLKKVDVYDDAIPGTDAFGAYSPDPEPNIVISRGLQKRHKNTVNKILRHELGHHVTIPTLDAFIDNNPTKFPTEHHALGAAEGLADNFAEKTSGKVFKGAGRFGSGYESRVKEVDKFGWSKSKDEIPWVEGYKSAAGKPARERIFHESRNNAQSGNKPEQLEIGFGQH